MTRSRLGPFPAVLLALSGASSAQVLRVQAGAPPGGDGSSWAQAIDDLNIALALATPGTQVWVAAGRYEPHPTDRTATFALPGAVEVLGGFAGTETSAGQRDPAANVTLLDGDLAGDDQPGFVNYGENSEHVVTAAGVAQAVLDGFTVRGGSLGGGAGIRAVGAIDLRLANLVVVENWALYNNNDGGGLFLFASTAEVTDCRFERNRATAGGAIVLPGATGSDCLVRRSFFRDNLGCAGGAILAVDDPLAVESCRFEHNGFRNNCGLGSGGGAIQVYRATAEITDSFFVDNNRNSLKVDGGGDVTVSRSSFFDVVLPALRSQDGSLVLDHCVVWGVQASQLFVGTNGSLSASYSDVRNNGAGLPGPGNIDADPLFVDAPGGDLHLTPASPCIDAGDPAAIVIGADSERDSRLLDGDLDGTLRIDMGADEHAPLHLEIQGTPTPGSTLTITSSGPAGLTAVLALGPPGARFLPQAGTLFLNLAGALRTPWPAPPSSVPVLVPPGLVGVRLHVQELGFGGGAFALSNYVPLQF